MKVRWNGLPCDVCGGAVRHTPACGKPVAVVTTPVVPQRPVGPEERGTAWKAGYRACTKALLARPGRRVPARPESRLRKRWASDWHEFCRGWAHRVADKQKADMEWV